MPLLLHTVIMSYMGFSAHAYDHGACLVAAGCTWLNCITAFHQCHVLTVSAEGSCSAIPDCVLLFIAAMAQRKSELLRLQTLERIAGFQQDLEAQLQIMLSNPALTSVQQSS